jgi:hypothetical protein
MRRAVLGIGLGWATLQAQEAGSGFELRTTLSAAAFHTRQLAARPRFGSTVTGGSRSVFYPTWKWSERWAVAGAIQARSRPYFSEEFSTQGHGVKADVLQLHLSYARFWKDRSVVVRVGQLSSAFGSFLLRYDDADNPLIDMPLAYGYYYKGVTNLGLAGAQVDVTLGRLDARAQFVNSNPSSRRSVFDREQYGNWAGGVGYTVRQGFRVGVSAYRGPYLHRQHRFYFPGEARPRDLPGSAYGVEVQWGHGAWTVYGELQRFQMIYRAIPTFNQHIGYAEVRRVLHPRWYAAARIGYIRHPFDRREVYDVAAGFRPNHFQLVKVGYQIQRGPAVQGTSRNVVAVQLVTAFRAFSIAGQ